MAAEGTGRAAAFAVPEPGAAGPRSTAPRGRAGWAQAAVGSGAATARSTPSPPVPRSGAAAVPGEGARRLRASPGERAGGGLPVGAPLGLSR